MLFCAAWVDLSLWHRWMTYTAYHRGAICCTDVCPVAGVLLANGVFEHRLLRSQPTAYEVPSKVEIPTACAWLQDAQGAPAATTLRNSFPNAPSRLHFPERPRTLPALGAAVASRAPDRGTLRATPLTPETRTACAQNLLADRLTYGPQYVPPMPAASADTTAAATAVPLTSRMSDSDSDPVQVPAGGRAAAPVAVRQPPPPLPQQPEAIETYLKVVAQLAALADGGVYGSWCCAVAEPRSYRGRAVFRKALDLMDVGVRPAHLAPLLREHTAKLQF